MILPPLISYETVLEYKNHYEKFYCRGKIYTFDNIRVFFKKTNFEHAFYESSSHDGKKDIFSRTRAERIDWIRMTIENPNAELYKGWNKGSKHYDNSRRVCILYENFVVVIAVNSQNPKTKLRSAGFITAYVADNSIDKIRNSPKWDSLEWIDR